MKTLLPISIILLALSACGGSGAANQRSGYTQNSPYSYVGACSGNERVGTWSGPNGRMYLNGDCTGYDEACDALFTWKIVVGANNTKVIASQSIGGSFCVQVGTNFISSSVISGKLNVALPVKTFEFIRIE